MADKKKPLSYDEVTAIEQANAKKARREAYKKGIAKGQELAKAADAETKPKQKRKKKGNGMASTKAIQTPEQMKVAYRQLLDKQKSEREPFKALDKPKHKAKEIGDKKFSESDIKQAGEAAIRKRLAQSKKKQKANAEAKVFQSMIMSTSAASAMLGSLQDRNGLFSKLPKLIKTESGEKHPANDDIIIGVVGYGGARVTSGMVKKALISTSLAAFNNAARIYGRDIKMFDKAVAKVREKLGIAAPTALLN